MHNNLTFLFAFVLVLLLGMCSALNVKFKITTAVSSLNMPRAVHVLANGDMFIAEHNNENNYYKNRILTVFNGTLSVFMAPLGNQPFIAVDEAQEKVYLSEYFSMKIRALNYGKTTITTLPNVMYFGKMLSIDKFHNWLLFMDVGNNCVGYYSLANYNSFNWFTNCGLSPTDGGIVASPLTGDIYYIYYGKIMRLVLPETYTIFSASTPDWNPYPEYPPFNDANFTATPWNNPMGLYYTAHDELFVADPGLKQVKKIQNRQVEIIAGSTNSSSGCPDNSDPVNCYLDSPFNVFVRENKNEIYIADDVAGLIKKVYPYCDGVGYVLSGDGRTCLPECYGKSSESKYPFLACHGNGTCVDVNTCMCNENYYGPECTVTTCFGKFSNSSTACNGNGICERYNYCKCNSNYGGENCEIPKCNGTLANDETVCSGNGSCIALNTCQCFNTSRYVGEKCEIPQIKQAVFVQEEVIVYLMIHVSVEINLNGMD
ncbi:predicted protein [Naegleria gruberi]|uniref:Predicted protein n=1 Tax=Naegleria gruberi TaxID=5762 RepID=D2W4G3_NAEGR|nr:uncharacterized protein NAEGRDRAFT_76295 [Naegleria gruberi]EFC36041.1 predicted protein [Naegleria gruberi]|eukprot:XP_002668785.1 predicted protein [Naegleria gruberi strain NEG-M]